MAKRSVSFRLIASTIVVTTVLGGLEAYARWVNPIVPTWQAPDAAGVIMTGHPTRLWGMASGVRRNGDTTASINELGLRGPTPEVPRPSGQQRILVLGDSSFFGHGIPDDATIAANLERSLKAAGVSVDVVNAGIPGYSTEQTKLLLEEVGWNLEPTLLVIGNLWSDNNADGFRDADLLKTNHAFYQNPLAKSAFFRLLAGWVDGGLDRIRGGSGGHIINWTRSSAWPEGQERRVPIQQYGANLDFMVKEAKRRGAGALFVTPTNQGLVDNAYKGGAGWDPYFATQQKVAAWNGLPIVSGTAILQADPLSTGEKFVDQMHPSSAGAADLGNAIASSLLSAGWPQNPLFGKDDVFDASVLVDDSHIPPGGQAIRLSPQAQLFPDVHTGPATQATGAPSPSTPVPLAPNPPSSVSTTSEIQGMIVAGTGPFSVSVQSEEGRPLSFTHLSRPGNFSLKIQADRAQVIVTDAAGHEQKAMWEKGKGLEAFRFP